MAGDLPEARSRLAAAALAFAIAGAAASWNPLAAPFGLVVGGGAALLALRAARRCPGRRRIARVALALGVLDGVVSLLILLLSAGLFRTYAPIERVVTSRTPAETRALLDAEAARTAEARERAIHELGAQSSERSARKGDEVDKSQEKEPVPGAPGRGGG